MKLGIDDPIHWFNHVDPDVIDHWIAYYSLEPFGDEWRQVGTVSAEINFQTAIHAARLGGEMPSIRTIESYMPIAQKDTGTISGKRVLTDEEAQYSLMVGFGFG